TPDRFRQVVGEMGRISLYGRLAQRRTGAVNVAVGEDNFSSEYTTKLAAGTIPEAKSFLDKEFLPPGALMTAHDWQTDKPTTLVMAVRTRPSVLYDRLFRTLGATTTAITWLLIFVGIVFAVVVLLAVFIGLRLTRTITRS